MGLDTTPPKKQETNGPIARITNRRNGGREPVLGAPKRLGIQRDTLVGLAKNQQNGARMLRLAARPLRLG
eukprot:2582606-Pyramimonas_sp.AAC.1